MGRIIVLLMLMLVAFASISAAEEPTQVFLCFQQGSAEELTCIKIDEIKDSRQFEQLLSQLLEEVEKVENGQREETLNLAVDGG